MNRIRYKIVLVDDSLTSLHLGKTLLQNHYKVYTVQSPVTFLANLEKDIPDLILLDVQMPEMSGFDVIKILKSDPRYREIPVMFLTSKNDAESEREGFRLGAVDYVLKPFSGPLLRKRISNQLLLSRVQSAILDYASNLDSVVDEVTETNMRLKIMLDSLPICCQLFNSSFEKIDCNEEAIRLFGFKDKKDYLERYPMLYPEFQDDGQRSTELIRKYLEQTVEEGRVSFNWTYRMLDGTTMPTEASLVRLNLGDDFVIAGYTRDLREEKRMAARIEAIMSNLPGMVFQHIYDPPEYTYTFVSEGSKELLGYTPQELTGNSAVKFLDLVLPEYFHSIEKLSTAMYSDGLPYESTFRIKTKEGTEKWIWERSHVVERNPDGTPRLIEGYYTDVTERQLLEAAEMANHAKSVFLATMSHEMRTPMNVLVGLTDLMLEEDSTPGADWKENLSKINTAGNTLLGLINDILDISKIEAGKFELTPVNYELPSLLNDIVALNVIRIEDKPITFQLDITGDLHYRLHGDDLRVKQIINNVLSNAFKYTQEGKVILGLTTERSKDDVLVSVYVRDTGIGIHKNDINKLFNEYGQLDARTNRTIEGTGLGLAITKQLVEMMDGEISVESEYGKGSVFRVRIRQGFVDDAAIGADIADALCNFNYAQTIVKTSKKKIIRPDLSHIRVLVVDDMQTNLDVVIGIFDKYKMQIDCALSGSEAYERMQRGEIPGEPLYDAIFMDHMMPGMDGIETAHAIRSLNTEYAKKIPIIALTANAVQGMEELFRSNNFQDFISKPVSLRHMDSVIRKWFCPEKTT